MRRDGRELREVRRELLEETARQARAQSTFWRARFEATGAATPLEAFDALGPLTKGDAIAAGDGLYAGPSPDDSVCLSSGTRREGGKVLLVRRCDDERRAFAALAAALGGEHPRPASVVELWNVAHGLPPSAPPPGVFVAPWMSHPNFPELALEALRRARAFGGGRVDALRGSVSAVMTLAAWCAQRGREARGLGVRQVVTNSYEVSPRARRVLEAAFGAPVCDVYSVSELPVGAPACTACAGHHLSAPAALPELLGGDGAWLDWAEGTVGRLVLTGLFPFVQRTPLLRYLTGDLVEATGFCHHAGDVGFRPLGRAADAVTSADGQLVLPAAELFRWADDVPGIARAVHPVEAVGLLPPSGLGAPKARGLWRDGQLCIRVALEPSATPPKVAGLLEASAAVRRFVARGGDVALERVPGEALPDRHFKP